MKRRRESPAMPQGYMAALGRLYGKPAQQGPKSAPESTQAVEGLPAPHSPKKAKP